MADAAIAAHDPWNRIVGTCKSRNAGPQRLSVEISSSRVSGMVDKATRELTDQLVTPDTPAAKLAAALFAAA